MDQKKLLMIAAGCGGAVFLGTLLPWWDPGKVSVAQGFSVDLGSASGTQFTVGVFVLILGLVGGAAALLVGMGKTDIVKLPVKQQVLIAGGAFGLAALLTLIKFFELSHKGFGIWLCLLGAIGGTVCVFMVLKQMGVIPASSSGDGGDSSGDGE